MTGVEIDYVLCFACLVVNACLVVRDAYLCRVFIVCQDNHDSKIMSCRQCQGTQDVRDFVRYTAPTAAEVTMQIVVRYLVVCVVPISLKRGAFENRNYSTRGTRQTHEVGPS